jgi:hypothetical protein
MLGMLGELARLPRGHGCGAMGAGHHSRLAGPPRARAAWATRRRRQRRPATGWHGSSQRTAQTLPRHCSDVTGWRLGRSRPRERRQVAWFDVRCAARDHAGGRGAEQQPKYHDKQIAGSAGASSRPAQRANDTVVPAAAAPTWMCCQVRTCWEATGMMVHPLSLPIHRALSRWWVCLNRHRPPYAGTLLPGRVEALVA